MATVSQLKMSEGGTLVPLVGNECVSTIVTLLCGTMKLSLHREARVLSLTLHFKSPKKRWWRPAACRSETMRIALRLNERVSYKVLSACSAKKLFGEETLSVQIRIGSNDLVLSPTSFGAARDASTPGMSGSF